MQVKLNWVNEWSSRESYTTLTLGEKQTTENSLKHELLCQPGLPVLTKKKNGEWLSEVGLSYGF